MAQSNTPLKAAPTRRMFTFFKTAGYEFSICEDKTVNIRQRTLSLRYRWQCFGENLKHVYFGSHIRTLLCSLCVVVLAMVVLAVIYLSHLRSCYVMSALGRFFLLNREFYSSALIYSNAVFYRCLHTGTWCRARTSWILWSSGYSLEWRSSQRSVKRSEILSYLFSSLPLLQ